MSKEHECIIRAMHKEPKTYMRNEIANDGNGDHFSKVRAPEARDGAQWVGRLSS